MPRKGRPSKPVPHRVEAERTLAEAQRNPVLSGAESCAVAHAHALLAIEERLTQLCTLLEATLAESVGSPRSEERARLETAASLVA